MQICKLRMKEEVVSQERLDQRNLNKKHAALRKCILDSEASTGKPKGELFARWFFFSLFFPSWICGWISLNCLSKIWKSTGLFDDEGGVDDVYNTFQPWDAEIPLYFFTVYPDACEPGTCRRYNYCRSRQADLNSSFLFSPTSRWFFGLKNQGLQKWDSKWDVTEKFNQWCVFGVSFLTSGSLNLRYNLFRIESLL